MMISTTVVSEMGHHLPAQFEPPDHCPRCHNGIQPLLEKAIWSYSQHRIEAAFRCPRKDCQRLFIGVYQDSNYPNTDWRLHYVEPVSPQPPQYPESIAELSSTFVEIMGQVAVAESDGLDQLVGMGMRKGLEFLMKSFAIKEHPDQKVSIEKSELGSVIRQYIQDANIKACAKRAAWLGNDETHFVRRWKDKDLTNLKDLIRLTVNWIENHQLTKRYQDELQE